MSSFHCAGELHVKSMSLDQEWKPLKKEEEKGWGFPVYSYPPTPHFFVIIKNTYFGVG